jgi:hypothetical protein
MATFSTSLSPNLYGSTIGLLTLYFADLRMSKLNGHVPYVPQPKPLWFYHRFALSLSLLI